MATHENLSSLFTAIADSIRGKTGVSAEIVADNFPDAIDSIVVRPPVLIKMATANNAAITVQSSSGEDLSVYNRAAVVLLPSGALTHGATHVVALIMVSPSKADFLYADKNGVLYSQASSSGVSATFGASSATINCADGLFANQTYDVILWRE